MRVDEFDRGCGERSSILFEGFANGLGLKLRGDSLRDSFARAYFLDRGDRFSIELGHSRYRWFVSACEAERIRDGKCREKI